MKKEEEKSHLCISMQHLAQHIYTHTHRTHAHAHTHNTQQCITAHRVRISSPLLFSAYPLPLGESPVGITIYYITIYYITVL